MLVLLDELGKCEYCHTLLPARRVPTKDGECFCPNCGKFITEKSFGLEQINDAWKRTRWIDENGQWTDKRSNNDFYLDKLFVVLEIPPEFEW
jgi:hypothetical protein